MRSLIEDEIDAEILHGRIEKFLDHLRQAVHFIDKENISPFQMGENADQISALLNGGAGGGHNVNSHFLSDDMGERRFPKPRRGMKEDVVQWLSPFLGSPDRNIEGLYDLTLTDIFSELSGPQIEIVFNLLLKPVFVF
jgi:hypothetical protein